MGVKGLLPCLRSITRPAPLEKYRGLTAAVDAMSWLHKGIYAGDVRSLARAQWEGRNRRDDRNGRRRASGGGGRPDGDPGRESAVRRLDFEGVAERSRDRRRVGGRGGGPSAENERKASEAATRCVAFAMRHAETLRRDFAVEVVLVIDGGSLPSKGEIDRQRREERREAFEQAQGAEARGDTRNARKLYARACSVTHEMRRELIERCKRAKMAFVVAPYEADAQMAQLAHSGNVDLVITEDSDLLAYGCPRILFKVDFTTRRGEEIQLMRDLAINDEPSFSNWTHDMFVYMCILSGCDYCEGIPGVGIKTAHKLVRMYRSPSKIFNALRTAGRMPDGFEESFWRAYRTFRHQRVYCQEREEVVPLLPIQEAMLGDNTDVKDMWTFLGPWICPEVARGIATGILHPSKKVPWDVELERSDHTRSLTSQHADAEESHLLPSGSIADEFLPPQHENTASSNPENTNNNNLFKFFPSKKRSERERAADESGSGSPSRPPLKEIFLQSAETKTKMTNDKTSGRGCTQPIPIHYNEYSSKLVGNTFETMSRRRRHCGNNMGRNISEVVQRLRNQTKGEKSQPKETEKHDGDQVPFQSTVPKDTMKHSDDQSSDGHVPSSCVSDQTGSVHNQAEVSREGLQHQTLRSLESNTNGMDRFRRFCEDENEVEAHVSAFPEFSQLPYKDAGQSVCDGQVTDQPKNTMKRSRKTSPLSSGVQGPRNCDLDQTDSLYRHAPVDREDLQRQTLRSSESNVNGRGISRFRRPCIDEEDAEVHDRTLLEFSLLPYSDGHMNQPKADAVVDVINSSCLEEHEEHTQNYGGHLRDDGLEGAGQADMSFVLGEQYAEEGEAGGFNEEAFDTRYHCLVPNDTEFAESGDSVDVRSQRQGHIVDFSFEKLSSEEAQTQRHEGHFHSCTDTELNLRESERYGSMDSLSEPEQHSVSDLFLQEIQRDSVSGILGSMDNNNGYGGSNASENTQGISPRDVLDFPPPLDTYQMRRDEMCSSSSKQWGRPHYDTNPHSSEVSKIQEWKEIADCGANSFEFSVTGSGDVGDVYNSRAHGEDSCFTMGRY